MASDLPVDLLEEIFLCLDDAADLVRVSAACTSFHLVVSHGRFLRRFRSLHRRPVLGLLVSDCSETALFHAAQPSWRSAQAAAGFAKAVGFNFAFLPDRSTWSVCDVRGGCVLLYQCPDLIRMCNDLVVYDPLHRRQVQIPTIPSDVVVPGDHQDDNIEATLIFDSPFLVPAVDDDDDDDVSLRFQVMCIAQSKREIVAFVFSSASRQWRRGTSFDNPCPSYDWALCFRQHVHDCVCWARNVPNVMLVFDTRKVKFYIDELPRESIGTLKMAVEAGDGRLGLLLLSFRGTTMDLYSKARQGIQEPDEWRHDSSIPVIPGFHLRMVSGGVAEGYALLRGIPQDQYMMWICNHNKIPEEAHYFTLEVKTLLVEKLCVLKYDESQTSFLYASFPPMFSSPKSMKL